jgi:hypothetical protein
MNCSFVRALLPLSLYGDLKPEEAATVEQHLTTCPACRRERAELERVRAALAALPAPAVQVDLPALYRHAAERHVRRARRWRRAALALSGVAAMLLVVVALGVEVQVGANRLSLRWGSRPPEKGTKQAKPSPDPPVHVNRRPAPQSPDVAERLRLMDDLIHALTADVEERDTQQRQRLDRLLDRLERVGAQARHWQRETERDVAALYAAQFVLTKKGDRP